METWFIPVFTRVECWMNWAQTGSEKLPRTGLHIQVRLNDGDQSCRKGNVLKNSPKAELLENTPTPSSWKREKTQLSEDWKAAKLRWLVCLCLGSVFLSGVTLCSRGASAEWPPAELLNAPLPARRARPADPTFPHTVSDVRWTLRAVLGISGISRRRGARHLQTRSATSRKFFTTTYSADSSALSHLKSRQTPTITGKWEQSH